MSERALESMYKRIHAEAQKSLQHAADVPQAEVVSAYKRFLQLENDAVYRFHSRGNSGLLVARARTLFMDIIIDSLYQLALRRYRDQHGEPETASCIVALGGYGRSELSPLSDIDLMFLYPERVDASALKPLQQHISDCILYVLWDLGLKVGHSSRTIREALDEAQQEIHSKNALLESRFLTGNDGLYQQFRTAYSAALERDSIEDYLRSRLQDQAERRRKQGGTVFVQQPDIKNGVGGLRDYQNILWMAQIKLGVSSTSDLVKHQYFTQEEVEELDAAYNFLMRVRHELHFQIKRAVDTLTLEKQPSIAWALGYRQKAILPRVENFMRDYYQHARNIFRHSKVFEKRLALSIEKLSFKAVIAAHRKTRRHNIDGFQVSAGKIYALSDKVFEEDPVRLIRLFRHCQQYQAMLEFDLTLLVRKSLHLIDRQVIHSPEANASFRSILNTQGDVYPALDAMHELGVLERFVPEFKELSCLVQHEFFHRYTADYHTLSTIKHLDEIFTSGQPEHSRYNREIRSTNTPGLLYVTLLLHDIGKGRGIKGHAEVGAVMASEILDRFGVNTEAKEKVLLIIRLHLEMARFWQRYDIDDPQTGQSFANVVTEPDILRYLYVHTYCDAKGTSENLWNSYKDMLHTQLFRITLDYFDTPEARKSRSKKKTMISRDAVLKLLPNHDPEEIQAHYNLLPERYFIHHSSGEVARHIQMVHNLLGHIVESESMASLQPIIDWQDDVNLSMSVVNVVTWDRAGLFYKLAGALSVAGLNILSSKAISREDHISIDTFYVCEPGGGIVKSGKARELFSKTLEEALLCNTDLYPIIQKRAAKDSKPAWQTKDQLGAPIPARVDVYHELSLKRNIIEVQAPDQLGFLYRFARAIYDHGFDITFARISTERNVAVDTFYIEPIKTEAGETADASAELLALRETLNKIILKDSDEEVAFTA